MIDTKPTAVIVIPAYNEADSIGPLLDYLFLNTLPTIPHWKCVVMIVDRNSADGTSSEVIYRRKKYPNLFLIEEQQNSDIGAAYVQGFNEAMKSHAADAIIEFNGNFIYPPETIPVLLQKIDEGADYVLGSRRIKGAKYLGVRGLKRRLISTIGVLIIRFILFFPSRFFFKITDPTTGLKASRVKNYIDQFDSGLHFSKSIGYRIEFLYRMVKLKAKVVEIPLKFNLQQTGESNIETQILKEDFMTALRLRLRDPETKRFIKFAVVGFSGFVINAVALELFRRSPFTHGIAHFFEQTSLLKSSDLLSSQSAWSAAFAAELAIISNFLLNNFWTFSTHKIKSSFKFITKSFQFNLTSIGAILIQFLVVGLATLLFDDTTTIRMLALVFSIVFLIIPYNWTIYNWIIWKVKKRLVRS
jgi:dolichol-phosphate mannosyltransferase